MKGGMLVLHTVAAGLLLPLVGPAQNAEAHWSRGRPHANRYYSHRGYGDHGWHTRVVVLPRGSVRIVLGGRPYNYCAGRFYMQEPTGYVIVPPPVGAQVAAIPADHQTVVVNGMTYHYYDGTYYKGGPAGYTVVPVPAAVMDAEPAMETTIVNVPNRNGSYMPVTLQLAKDGTYIGPKGEVYSTKPDISQLKEMYGK